MENLSASKSEGEGRRRLPNCRIVEFDLGDASFLGYRSEIKGAVLCAPSEGVHPQQEKIQELHEQWAVRVGLWSEENIADLRVLNFSRLWTGCVPELSAEDATLIPDYCLMYTVLDDTVERFIGQEGRSAFGVLREAFLNYEAVLRGDYEGGHDVPHLRYPRYYETCAIMADLRERIQCFVDSRQYERFLDGFASYRQGVVQQVYLSGRGLPLSRETQIYNREMNVAFAPTVDLIAIMKGVKLKSNALAHPLFDRVFRSICRLGGIVNDIISFQKETKGDAWLGQYHNLVAAEFNELVREGGGGNLLNQAIQRVFQVHNNEMYDFMMYGSLISQDCPSFEEYHDLCGVIHRSWLNWCLRAERYSQVFTKSVQVREAPVLDLVQSFKLFQVPESAKPMAI